jgi:integrase
MRGSNSNTGGWISTEFPGIYYRLNAKGQKVYGVDFRDADGVRRRERVDGNLKEAKRQKARLDGSDHPVKRTSTRFGDYAKAYLERRTDVDEETKRIALRQLRQHIPAWLKQRKLHEIGARDIYRLLDELAEKGLGRQSVDAVRYSVVSASLAQAVRENEISANPSHSVRRTRGQGRDHRIRPEQTLSPEEFGKLLAAASGVERLILQMLIFTGLRVSELCGLTWADVDLEKGLLHVAKQLAPGGGRKQTKTRSVRDVNLSSQLAQALWEHRKAALQQGQAGLDSFVFCGEGGEPWYRQKVGRLLDETRRKAGLRPLQLHWCRHTFASILLSDPDVDIYYVSQQLGHKKATITLDVYGHLYQRERKAEIGRATLDAFSI